MAVYRNADYSTRVWPHIQRPDGRTLELEPGETVELDLPEGFEDVHLEAGPFRRGKRPKKTDETPTTDATDETTTEQDGDGAAETEDQGDAGSSDVAVETPQES